MISPVFVLAFTSAFASSVTAQTPSFSSVTAAPSSLPLGAVCSSRSQCANGADCYGVTAFTITTCGSFQSICTSNNQCATNTCQNGFCNGYLDPSLYPSQPASSTSGSSSSASQSATSSGPILPVVTAAPRSLQVGSVCSEDEQCPVGVACYGTASFTIKTCGSFNSPCSNDTQCSTNTCQSGFCSGFLPEASYRLPNSTQSSTSASSSSTVTSTSTSTAFSSSLSSSLVSSTRSSTRSSSSSLSTSSTASFVPSGGSKSALLCNGGFALAFMAIILGA